MTEHTPGPWEHRGWGIYDADGFCVAEVGMGVDRADGNLIAAAPDLLAACEALLRDVEEEGLENTGSAALARAAIAKARGE